MTGIEKSVPTPVLPAVVVFGTDDAGKSHASWFEASEATLATKAASLMGMTAIPLATDEHRAVVTGVARGRVFGSGRAFVPFAKASLHAKLAALAEEVGVLSAPAPDRDAGGPDGGRGQTAPGNDEPGEPAHRPKDWPEIQLGSIVLMSEGVGHGWYVGVVTEAKPDDLFVLKWRDWPEEPTVVRRREHLALFHPDFVDE